MNHVNIDSDQTFKLKGVFEDLEKVEVPEIPSWRKDEEPQSAPAISGMLEDITTKFNFINDLQGTQEYQTKLYKLKLEFVLSTNRGENEGTQSMASTQEAINHSDNSNSSSEEQVTRNLFVAINHFEDRNTGKDKGLLDVEELILDTHKKLMRNLLPLNKQGHFSTEERKSTTGYVYPKFDTEDEAHNDVQRLVDQYNNTVKYIKEADLDPTKRNSMFFRCAAWILYKFVCLHPFADGNGRMCRLLASHCLYLVFPFPCPIYNIFAPTGRDDYLNAIFKADKTNGQDLGNMVALLIESGWYAVKHFVESN